MICEKCKRVYPDNLQQPFRCYCNGNVLAATKLIEENRLAQNNLENNSINPNTEHYHKLWEKLHSYQYDNPKNTEFWFKDWSSQIPCGTCKAHWQDLILKFPPDYSSAENFFKWTVEAHNKVNERLGKSIVSIEEAKKIWYKT